ncbi:Trk system potassium transporter TrkA [Halobacterium jilantaiense]|uniref:Trk system potassium uptake protein TrkA n=1 Tax=Halobacterium jilantaiense TaxID=355548 RepID=A0A1I0QC82_9EURY|nr:Trk system potassium transporter TrkA [Halobacterium jilantaiense]SEW24419.1 trk system potassium uptake protein TrkA [Halobacterium jilantaiense]
MRILIVGAGEVGSSIAGSLAGSHEVVVVDRDADRVESIQYSEDVLGVTGDGTDLDVLQEAEVAAADVVISVTNSEETNLIVCATAKTRSDAFTIARVEQTNYLDTWQAHQGAFGVDFLVCTNLLAAQTIVRIVGLPSARDVNPFADGRVEMAEFDVPDGSPLAGQTVAEADRFDELTFVAVIPADTDDAQIAGGDTVLEPGSRVVVVGLPQTVREFARTLFTDGELDEVEDVVVVGGSKTGELTAHLLVERGLSPRVVEVDDERARDLAERVPNATILSHDATDPEFLTREHVQDADVVVATLGSDERSLLAALLAKRVGADRAIAVVDQPRYVELFEAVGVDVAVNPREVTAEEITRFTRERRAENVAIVGSGGAEVLEVEITDESVLAGRTIEAGVADLPAGVVLGAITRDDELVTPRGDTVVEVGDHVVAFAQADAVDEVTSKL